MDYMPGYGNSDYIQKDESTQSEYHCGLHDSHSSRMIVSDADDDDASFVQTRANNNDNNRYTIFKGNDFMKVGSSSPLTSNDAMDVDDPRRVTPSVQDSSDETMARSTIEAETIILPLCPSLQLTDDRKTLVTIQPRDACAQNSHTKLVDKYAVKYDCRRRQDLVVQNESTFSESTERHDFNACRKTTSNRKPEDILRVDARKKIGIQNNENLLERNQTSIPHKIANSTSSTTSNGHNDKPPSHLNPNNEDDHNSAPNHYYNHKIVTSNNATMPSKVAPCLPRQRSRAIAIKRSRPGEFVDTATRTSNKTRGNNYLDNKEPRQCDVELYDYATWRMYNRIIDHRRKNPLPTHRHQDDDTDQGYHPQDDDDDHQQHSRRTLKNSQLLSHRNTQADEHGTSARMNHPSSITHGQRYYVRHNVLYTDDGYLSYDEDDEIFDLEL